MHTWSECLEVIAVNNTLQMYGWPSVGTVLFVLCIANVPLRCIARNRIAYNATGAFGIQLRVRWILEDGKIRKSHFVSRFRTCFVSSIMKRKEGKRTAWIYASVCGINYLGEY